MAPNDVIGLKEFSSVLFQIVMAAFIVERALALVFEWDLWLFLAKKVPWLDACKEVIAFGTSYTIVVTSKFDALRTLFNSDLSDTGQIITALVIAGGSKGAIKLMQDVWGIKNIPNGGDGTSPGSAPAGPAANPAPSSQAAPPPATGTREGVL